jgi:hypothetical protein
MTSLSNEAPRLRSSRLGSRTVRVIDQLRCPKCANESGNHYPEETADGWRLVCRACHATLVVTEDDAIDDDAAKDDKEGD